MDIKVNCIYHKHWYEPVENGNTIPKHIQIDRCTLGFQAIENCTECTAYTHVDQEDERKGMKYKVRV